MGTIGAIRCTVPVQVTDRATHVALR